MRQEPAYEARVMKHPHARKGKITPIEGIDANSGKHFKDSHGDPDTFPDVTVRDPTTEAYYRAQGYLVPGEAPAPPAEYAEYPVMLTHPHHVDLVPDDYAVEKAANGEIIRHRIPGSPEKFPPMQANDADEEAALGKKGYARAGQDDPDAIRTAKASPHVPGRKTQEFPKMVNGVLEDPDAQVGGPVQYPKWVGDKMVNNRAEEEALTGKKVDVVIDTCIICDEVILAGEPKGVGKNGNFHLSHVPASQGSAQLPDGRVPLVTTARQERQKAREAVAQPIKKARGRPPGSGKPKVQAEA